MSVGSYYCVDGEFLGDTESGDYLRDALCSVMGTTSPINATVQNTCRYKLYGGQLASAEVAPTPSSSGWEPTATDKPPYLAAQGSYEAFCRKI